METFVRTCAGDRSLPLTTRHMLETCAHCFRLRDGRDDARACLFALRRRIWMVCQSYWSSGRSRYRPDSSRAADDCDACRHVSRRSDTGWKCREFPLLLFPMLHLEPQVTCQVLCFDRRKLRGSEESGGGWEVQASGPAATRLPLATSLSNMHAKISKTFGQCVLH